MLVGAAAGAAAHRKSIGKAADPLVRQYGLRGAPPATVDRAKRQAIWEARAEHLNRRRDRWERTRQGANVAEKTGAAVAGSAMHIDPRRTRKVVRAAASGSPGYKTLTAGAAGAGVAAGAGQLRRHAAKKTRKYSTASGGIASGTAARMKDYDIGKSAFGVAHDIDKGLGKLIPGAGKRAAKAAAAAKKEPVTLEFKPIVPKGPMTGPGSLRHGLDPSAWQTRSAAATRGVVGKSAFGVADPLAKGVFGALNATGKVTGEAKTNQPAGALVAPPAAGKLTPVGARPKQKATNAVATPGGGTVVRGVAPVKQTPLQ